MILQFKKFLYKWIYDYNFHYKKIARTGLSFEDYLCFKYRKGCINDKISETSLLQTKIKRTNSYWYTQTVLEIFDEEIYKFTSSINNPLILDCGSNIGISIIYFKNLYPDARIIGFEPDKEMFDICQYNCQQFNLNDVNLVNAAVWSENTELNFLADGALGGHLTLDDKNLISTKVNAVKLSSYLDQKIDLLKMDIEGAEYEVLKSCKDDLGNVQNLFVEYHSFRNDSQKLDEILNILSEAGFRYYIKEAWQNMKKPFVDYPNVHNMDSQLNIFAYRI